MKWTDNENEVARCRSQPAMMDILETLNEIRAFLDAHADADHYEIGNGLIPNKAMILMFALDEVIGTLKPSSAWKKKLGNPVFFESV
jgi:hypothetical protein